MTMHSEPRRNTDAPGTLTMDSRLRLRQPRARRAVPCVNAPLCGSRRTSIVPLCSCGRDTPFSVSWKTATRHSDEIGLTETQVFCLALAEPAAKHLPKYPRITALLAPRG